MGHRLEVDALAFLDTMTPGATEVMGKEIKQQGGVKVTFVVTVELDRLTPSLAQVYYDDAEPDMVTTLAIFRSTAMHMLNRSEMGPILEKAKAKILKSLEDYTHKGSSWRLKHCTMLELGFAQYQPVRGRSYVPTPKCI